jgi:hypothetical protein
MDSEGPSGEGAATVSSALDQLTLTAEDLTVADEVDVSTCSL